VSIGQGEVNVTPLQVANEMAYIANKGWFVTPHIVDSIDGGDKFDLLKRYKNRNRPIDIPDSIFTAVHDGMQGVVERGTGAGAKVPGIIICGKTGTVENYYRGVIKLKNHSFFAAFAPRDNPKIALMCVVENSGRFGGTYAAPIISFMIEKYLNDTIASDRKALEERMANTNLIPEMMVQKLKTRDSLRQVRADSMLQVQNAINDTLQSEEIPEQELNKPDIKKDKPANDTPARKQVIRTTFILPDEKKYPISKKPAAGK
jgi:penicillin-binding protein 2